MSCFSLFFNDTFFEFIASHGYLNFLNGFFLLERDFGNSEVDFGNFLIQIKCRMAAELEIAYFWGKKNQ